MAKKRVFERTRGIDTQMYILKVSSEISGLKFTFSDITSFLLNNLFGLKKYIPAWNWEISDVALENYITKAYDDNSEVAKNQEKVEDKQKETEMEMFYSLATLILQEQKEDLQKDW